MTVSPNITKILALSGFAVLSALMTVQTVSAMDPRFELDAKELSSRTVARSVAHGERRTAARKTLSGGSEKGVVHTIRSGDNIFKILMRDYGFSNDEAEACIEEIRRENNIYDIKRLRVGQQITIPMLKRTADGAIKKSLTRGTSQVTQALRLEAPVSRLSDEEATRMAQQGWNSIVPAQKTEQKPITLSSASFSLTLDPQRYPVYAAFDGGKIIVDSAGTIPPLVRSLITEKDPTIRVISDSPANSRRFMNSLLGAAGFYSFEENFTMEFGSDPKLIVNTDFKIEKTKNSLVQQDVTLVNAGRETMPPAIVALLKKEGFTLHEPFATVKNFRAGTVRRLHQITVSSQPEIVDALLTALALPAAADRQVDVFAADNNGISLSVKAERYFEKGKERFAITRFDGDPVTYTLFRILETKGYKVVILEQKDDFKQVAEKLLSRMNIHNSYRQHTLLKNGSSSYQVQMSGIMLDDSVNPLFITNLPFDRTIQDVLTENGYIISKR